MRCFGRQTDLVRGIAICRHCLGGLAKFAIPEPSRAWTILRLLIADKYCARVSAPISRHRGLYQEVLLGLDLAKDSFVAVVLDAVGRVVQQRAFANTPAGFAELLDWLSDPRQTLAWGRWPLPNCHGGL